MGLMAAMGWYTLWLGFEQLEWCSVGAVLVPHTVC